MTGYLLLFVTSIIFIALRAFQQLNVQHDRYWWVPITSSSMAVVEVLSITNVVHLGTVWAAIPMGLGSAIGCLGSMWLHARLRRRKQ